MKTRFYTFNRIVLNTGLLMVFLFSLFGGSPQIAAAVGINSQNSQQAVVVIPTPTSPTGTISDTTPAYKWTRIKGATKYSFTLYKGTLEVYSKTVLNNGCGTSLIYCVSTPTNLLTDGLYKWKVRAYVGNLWKNNSTLLTFTVKAVPTLKSPIGTVTDSTPTFKWSKIKNATKYTLNLYNETGLKYSKIVFASACDATTCSTAPSTVLAIGKYKWKVQSYVGGVWNAYSALKYFNLKKLLRVWSFSNEVMTSAIAFKKDHPDVEIEYTMIPMTNNEYQDAVLAAVGTANAPDVIALEAAFVKEFVADDFLSNLNSLLPAAATAQTYQHVIDMGTYNGITKAFSYQITPGALFYRRSLATEYFGNDDPAVIGPLLSNWTSFTTAAAKVKADSSGNTVMVGSYQEFMRVFLDNRSQPWVVDNTLTIDPMVDSIVDNAKTYRDNGYSWDYFQWQDDWFAGMNDAIPSGKQVFSYFLPAWGLTFVLMPNGPSTGGDWAVVAGPMQYEWGGTWLGVMKNSSRQTLATEFVRFATLDTVHLTKWATGVYTHEYLAALDPNIPSDLYQRPGDLVSSKLVVDDIKDTFTSGDAFDFLGGQNFYEFFAEAALGVSTELVQSSDDTIYNCLNDSLLLFVGGGSTEDEMWSNFKTCVATNFPELIIP